MFLDINGTDIDSGVEYLPIEKLTSFVFGNSGRTEAGVNIIQHNLAHHLGLDIVGNDLNDWASDTGNYDDADMAYEKVGIIRD